MQSFINELFRRNLIRVAGAYAVVGWVLIQLSIALETSLHLPNWFDSLVTSLVFLGFPVAMVLTWALEMAPDQAEGPNPSATKRSWRVADIGVMVGVFLIVALMAWQALTAAPIGSTAAPMQDAAFDQGSNAIAQNYDARSVADHLSIAVLPFDDFSIEGDQAYFANGIAEEILNTLAQVQGLTVTSRASSFTFQGRETPLREIGEALNVAHVLDGSVRKSGNQLRITAQLIDTNTDVNVWSGTYDRPLSLDNIFAIQDEIALQIVEALRSELALPGNAAEQRPTSLEAYQLYLRGREQMHRRQPESLAAARQDFERVIELDPGFAPAYAGMADTILLTEVYAGRSYREAHEEAGLYLDRAIELAPASSETLVAQATWWGMRDWRSELVSRDFALAAISVNPNSSLAFHRLAHASMNLGRIQEGIEAYSRALELDPLSIILQYNNVWANFGIGNWAAAEQHLTVLEQMYPGHPVTYWGRGMFEFYQANYAAAADHVARGLELNPTNRWMQLLSSDISRRMDLPSEVQHTNAFDRSLALLRENNLVDAARIIDGPEFAAYLADAPPGDGAEPFYLARRFDETEIILSAWLTWDDDADVLIPWGRLFTYGIAADIYTRSGDPKAEIILDSINRHFQIYPIEDTQMTSEYFDKAVMHVLRGEDETALDSLDAFVAAGHVSPWLEIYPAFDSLRELPRYQAVVAANDQNAARHRADIEALQSVERSQH